MELWMLVTLAMLAELGLHYFPWRLLLRGRELPRVAAYVLGVLGLALPFSAYLWERGQVDVLVALWVTVASGGIVVIALYALDYGLDVVWRERESRERENAKDKRAG
jgi:hypothetical protein